MNIHDDPQVAKVTILMEERPKRMSQPPDGRLQEYQLSKWKEDLLLLMVMHDSIQARCGWKLLWPQFRVHGLHWVVE